MPENVENTAVATGLEKVSFHFSLKETQCQRMLKLPGNCTHLTRYGRIPKVGLPAQTKRRTEGIRVPGPLA